MDAPKFLNKDGKRDAYAWPGGYPIVYAAADGEPLCPKCANLPEAMDPEAERDWLIVACGINWEDPELYCAHCEKRIESAYAESD